MRFLVVGVALILGLLCGCDDSEPDARDAKPNPLLLTAREIGGGSKPASLRSSDTASPTLCGPDSDVIRQGSNQRDFAAFNEGDQRVVVGAWEHPASDVELWLRDMSDKAGDPTCTEGAYTEPSSIRWIVTRIPTKTDTSAVFSWTRWKSKDKDVAAPQTPTTGDGVTAVSGVRGYRLVGRHVVVATITNTTTTPPDPAALQDLLDRQTAKVDTTPGLAGPDTCGLLEDQEIRAALGAKPRTIVDESTDREDSATNTLTCRYLGRDDAQLTFRGQRESPADAARIKLAVARGACSAAEELDTSTMASSRATGFVCPGTDGTVKAWLEWQSILLQIELAPSDGASPSEAADRIRTVATDLNRAMTFDAFGS